MTLLQALAHNVGDPQPPMCSASALWTVAVADGSLGAKEALDDMDHAIETGEVIRWTDGDGTVRYGLTDEGLASLRHVDAPVLSPEDADALRRYLGVETSRENPSQEFVGWVNRRLSEVQ